MVQDAPLMTQVAIGPALLARMARELEARALREDRGAAYRAEDHRGPAGRRRRPRAVRRPERAVPVRGAGPRRARHDAGQRSDGGVRAACGTCGRQAGTTRRARSSRATCRSSATSCSRGSACRSMKQNLCEWGVIATTRVAPSHAHAGRDRLRGARRPPAHARPGRCTPASPTRRLNRPGGRSSARR